jgi:hypothetical protein
MGLGQSRVGDSATKQEQSRYFQGAKLERTRGGAPLALHCSKLAWGCMVSNLKGA